MRHFESGALVGFAEFDSPKDGLLAGEPGTVIDDNGPHEITVSFVRGPSLSLSVKALTVLPSHEWHRRAARIAQGMHPTGNRLIE